jgi:hypothetical protein
MKARIALLCAALLGIAAVGAYAAIPGANGLITACVNPKGSLKVIDAEAGETCGSQQTLTWSQTSSGLPIGSLHRVTGESVESTAAFKSKTLFCPAGTEPSGGGASLGGADVLAPIAITRSLPTAAGWYASATAMAPVAEAWKLQAYLICVEVS